MNIKIEKVKDLNLITITTDKNELTRSTKIDYRYAVVHKNQEGMYYATYHRRYDLAEQAQTIGSKILEIPEEGINDIPSINEVSFTKVERDWVSSNGYVIRSKVFPITEIVVLNTETREQLTKVNSIRAGKEYIRSL